MKYKFTATNATGKKVTDEIEAPDERSAAKLLAAHGLQVIKISEKSKPNPLLRWRGRVSGKDKVVFSRQLSTLINASLPLLQSLRLTAEQTPNKTLKATITDIANELEGGVPFSKALSRHEEIFSPVFIGVVSAGETSGTLDASLERLAIQQERDADIVSKVRGSMVYPAIILVVMLAVVVFMIVKVLPQVQHMYSGLAVGVSMPLITRALLAIANFIIHYWWIVVFGLTLAVYFFRRWTKTQNGIATMDNLKLKGPLIGGLFMKLYMARFARISSTLLASGLPLLQVLEITGNAIDNVHVEKSITTASEKVRGGNELSEALTNDPNFAPLVPNMIRIGEQSGALEKMMGKTAEYYEKEVDEEVRTISTTIEPVLMIIMGVFALVVVAAILLPIYGLVGKSISVG